MLIAVILTEQRPSALVFNDNPADERPASRRWQSLYA
jgi:hypothetical protein